MKINGDVGDTYVLSGTIENQGDSPFDYAHFTHKIANQASFSLAIKQWTIRQLNTTDTNIIQGMSLDPANYWVTVPAGIYRIKAYAYYSHGSGGTILRLYDVTNSQSLALSGIGYNNNTSYKDGSLLILSTEQTFASQINLRLEQWAEGVSGSIGSASGGEGWPGSSGAGSTDPIAGIEFIKVT